MSDTKKMHIVKKPKRKLLYALWIVMAINIITIIGYVLWLNSPKIKEEIHLIVNETWNVSFPATLFFMEQQTIRSFVIDYDNNQFLKDGEPFRYVSGSLHYFRVPRFYWRDRLRKYRAAGLNVISTYVEWSTHEPAPNDYRFEGEQDLEHFLRLAAEEDLLVILRPGPYICAERDFGGLPPWLMSLYPNIKLRTDDSDYQREVQKWFDVLFPRLEKHLYGNGGPIIMVQVENEYGLYHQCSIEHRIWLRDSMKWYVDNNAVLFTIDSANTTCLECGTIPGVYATIDFPREGVAKTSFLQMQKFSPKGPLVDSEYYTGWISWWGRNLSKVDTDQILPNLQWMLQQNASVNFYMMHGGTNFGFTNGANKNDTSPYLPQLTSYDYDAPLNEAGDPTSKYFAIKDLISKFFDLPNHLTTLEPTPKGKYGEVILRPLLSVFDYARIPETKTFVSPKPKTFEELNLNYGYMLYETQIHGDVLKSVNASQPVQLVANGVRDRAIVYLNRTFVDILSRTEKKNTTQLRIYPNATLSLLVENQGRINYGKYLKDRKGLLTRPRINGKPLESWRMVTLPFTNVTWAKSLEASQTEIKAPAIYAGELILPPNTDPRDTYIDPTGWGKGFIFVNDFNLGRYWPSRGPQVTLYVPRCYLRPAPEKNFILIFETDSVHPQRKLVFTDTPILNKTTTPYH